LDRAAAHELEWTISRQRWRGFLGGHPNSLRGPVARGFSAGATDTGHEGGSGKFALDADGRQNWQGIIDNAYLGIHEMTVMGKALTKTFYGKAPRFAIRRRFDRWPSGTHGAQRFPDDYDALSPRAPPLTGISSCPPASGPR